MNFSKIQDRDINELQSGVIHQAMSATTLYTFSATTGYPRYIHCNTAGTLAMTDHADTAVSWTVLAGQDIFFRPKTITTSTTVTGVIVW